MKKMLLATALALLITGCAQQTFTVQNKPAAVAPKETITHHFFVSGIGQKKTVDAAKICGGAENVVKTETRQTFVNGLLGFITLIYILIAGNIYDITIITHDCHRYWSAHLPLLMLLPVLQLFALIALSEDEIIGIAVSTSRRALSAPGMVACTW